MASKSLVFKIGADMSQFRTAMDNASKSIAKVGKKVQNVGKNMTTYVTAPITALGAASVIAWDKQAQAIAQVESGLRTTGAAVGYTSEQLQQMAADLQKTSLFGDEEILKNATAQLLTFTNIAGEQFSRTQQAALDLSTRLDGDLKSASIQLGKALNDPVANLSALSRSGIQFSESQKIVIKELANTNKLAEAQTIILDELEKQYGGSAEAAAEAGLGPFKQLGNSIGDLTEDFGKLITEALNPFIGVVKSAVEYVGSLSDSTKKWIVIIGGVVAAIGPFLLALGTIMQMAPLITTALGGIAAAFNAINWPIVAVVAAIAGFVAAGVYMWDNWEAITQNMTKAWVATKNFLLDGIIAIVKGITWFSRTVLEALGFDALSDGVDFIVDKLEGLKDPLPEVTEEFGSFGDSVSNAMDAIFPKVEAVGNEVTNVGNKAEVTAKKIQSISGSTRVALEPLPEMTENTSNEFLKLDEGINSVDESIGRMGKSGTLFNESFQTGLDTTLEKIRTVTQVAQELFGQLFSVVSQMMDNKSVKEENELKQSIARVNKLKRTDVITSKEAEERILELKKVSAQRQADIKRKQFKTEKAMGIATAIIHGALAVTQALSSLPPPASYAVAAASAGLAAAQVAVIASKPMPAFADGGLVFGPTMGLVGEGVGTTRSNPEVIAPLDKLKNFLKPQDNGVTNNLTVTGMIRGEDIYLSNKNSQLAYANLVG